MLHQLCSLGVCCTRYMAKEKLGDTPQFECIPNGWQMLIIRSKIFDLIESLACGPLKLDTVNTDSFHSFSSDFIIRSQMIRA